MTSRTSTTTTLRDEIRSVREQYDRLPRGLTATLRRCHTEDDVALEGVYWRIGGSLAHRRRPFATVVLLFPLAPHRTKDSFAFGRHLRAHLGDSDSAALRFRRLLDCRSQDELAHRLRGVLKLASRDRAPVDWGVLGSDILSFFHESNFVRRRWAQDFYAPISREQDARPAT